MRRLWLWLLSAALLLALAVVWGEDSVELGDWAVVVGLGLEEAPAGLTVIIEVASQPGGTGPGESQVFTASGTDFAGCARQLSQQLEKRLFWHDCALLLVNRDLPERELLLAELYEKQLLSPETPLAEYSGSGAAVLAAGFGGSDFTASGLAGSLDKQTGQDTLTLADYLRQPGLAWPQVETAGEVEADE